MALRWLWLIEYLKCLTPYQQDIMPFYDDDDDYNDVKKNPKETCFERCIFEIWVKIL